MTPNAPIPNVLDSSSAPSPADAVPPSARPYVSPSLSPLGTVEAVTAGPVADGGNLDALVGLSGGFVVASDPLS